MLSSGIIDVAIGVTFVFILVSTLCSAIREGLESWLKTRASYLEYAVRELLHDRAGTGLARELFGHPWVSGLFPGDYQPRSGDKPNLWKRGRNLPSYIPSKNFALALMDITARGPSAQSHAPLTPLSFDGLRESVSKLPPSEVRRALVAAIDAAQGDLERVRTNLEAWYDSAMDRVSGWYKRSTQYVIFSIALLTVGALNINTITIADALYRNSALREAAVAASQHAAQAPSYDDALKQFDRLRLPIGWDGGWGAPRSASEKALLTGDPANAASMDLWNDAVAPILGLLMTAFAAMLGAPFWFDVLNKVTFIRATLKPQASPAADPTSLSTAPVPQLSAAGFVVAAPGNDVDGCVSDVPLEQVAQDHELPAAQGGVA